MENSGMKVPIKRPSPWVAGSFYLIVFLVVVVTLLVVARMIPIIVFPIILIGGILALSVIGAFQFRQDDRLNQKNFLELMALTFKYLPWLKGRELKTKLGNDTGNSDP
jgi:hypothetical protein